MKLAQDELDWLERFDEAPFFVLEPPFLDVPRDDFEARPDFDDLRACFAMASHSQLLAGISLAGKRMEHRAVPRG
jgi:hypothetical protein